MRGRKWIPNVISTARILMTFGLIVTEARISCYFVLYFLCGISDVLDGFLARKWKVTSQMGAKLDSAADTFFFLVVLVYLATSFSYPPWVFWWIGAILLLRFASLGVGYAKYHCFAPLHTTLNKLAGLAFFFYLPVLSVLFRLSPSSSLWTETITAAVCTIVSFSALEELLIQIRSQALDRNVKSIFSRQ